MATLTSTNNASRVENENAIDNGKLAVGLRKKGLRPVTRSGLGDVTNKKLTDAAARSKQYSKRQPTKPKDEKKAAPIKLDDVQETEEPMEMGTPVKVGAVESNIFDLAGKLQIEDIDKDDLEDPQLCSEFVNDIYQYMLYLEAQYPIRKQYLKNTGLKPRVRTILVDWLFQVHHRFNLLQETFYLTVCILDRFLQEEPVSRNKLQLAGVTAMLLASKYEEMYAPEVNDFVYITDHAFTHAQILQMEIRVLKTLKFNLGRPLPLHFLRRNSKAGQVDASHHALAKYLMELSTIDYEMCHVPPSLVAASALCLSMKLLDDLRWSSTLEHYSNYSYEQLKPVICHLAKNLKAAESNTHLAAVRQKFSSQKVMKIALIEEVKSPYVAELAEQAANVAL